jgi:hypothetical protein
MRSPASLLVLVALAAPAAADTVYLVNGNAFEEVIAETAAGEVRIRMPHGEIVLPDRVVARVERSPSAWQEFAERERGLRAASSTPRQWLDLARWADEAGFRPGMRVALLRAAELDPGLDGLAPLMKRSGYIRDPESGEWLNEADYMRRRGYRLWDDHWLPEGEYERRLRAHREAETRRREDARQERIARAIEALVVAELSRAAASQPAPRPPEPRGPLVAVYTGGYFPFGLTAGVGAPAPVAPEQATFDDLVDRQPGSLFPVRPRRHLSSRD